MCLAERNRHVSFHCGHEAGAQSLWRILGERFQLQTPISVIMREMADPLEHIVAELKGGSIRGPQSVAGASILPRAALFVGASGTGKTMAAGAIASELGADLHRIDLSRIVSKYIGETEKNIDRVFNEAEKGGAVLQIDEADALFGKRFEVRTLTTAMPTWRSAIFCSGWNSAPDW